MKGDSWSRRQHSTRRSEVEVTEGMGEQALFSRGSELQCEVERQLKTGSAS